MCVVWIKVALYSFGAAFRSVCVWGRDVLVSVPLLCNSTISHIHSNYRSRSLSLFFTHTHLHYMAKGFTHTDKVADKVAVCCHSNFSKLDLNESLLEHE